MKLNFKKILRLTSGASNNSGIIIFIVLWIMVILSLLVVSLGRGSHVDLAMAKNSLGQAKADFIAWGGLMYAIKLLDSDNADTESAQEDTIFYCGIRKDQDAAPEKIFRHQELGSGYFDVRYPLIDKTFQGKPYMYGMEDEERRININALNPQNAEMLSSLITLIGFDHDLAQSIAASVIDWKDADGNVFGESFGAEDEYYKGLDPAYHCKNAAMESIEELMLVRGMTREIFEKIKPFVTVFPKTSNLSINIDTASEEVLRALARSVAGPLTNTNAGDADSLVDKLLDYRRGDDSLEFTADDRAIDQAQLSLNAKETALFMTLNQYRTKKSNYFRISVRAKDSSLGVERKLQAIVYRPELRVIESRWN